MKFREIKKYFSPENYNYLNYLSSKSNLLSFIIFVFMFSCLFLSNFVLSYAKNNETNSAEGVILQEDINSEKNTELEENIKSQNENYNCEENRRTILRDLKTDNPTCFVDEDCTHFNYGYPFQVGACIKAIVSKKDEEKTIEKLSKIEEYRENCVYDIEEELQKYIELRNNLVNEENSCNIQRVYCLKGFCRRKNYVVHFFNNDDFEMNLLDEAEKLGLGKNILREQMEQNLREPFKLKESEQFKDIIILENNKN